MEFRANLCMHLYRELARIEPDENKRYSYLTLCYELFDAGEPDNMTEEETIEYRLKVIDTLNNQGLILNYGFLERSEVEDRNCENNNNQPMNVNDILANVQYALSHIKKKSDRNDDKMECSSEIPKIEDYSISSRESADIEFKEHLTHRTSDGESSMTLSAKKLDKGLESYKLLLDQLEGLRLSSNHSIQQILAKDEMKMKSLSQSMDIQDKPLKMEFEEISETKRPSATCNELNKFENIIETEDNDKGSSREIGSSNKWQHRRYIIAAPAIILHLFKSNPAYQCSSIAAGAPNLYEELEQFYEMMAHPNSSLTKLIDVSAVQMRLKVILDRVKKQLAGKFMPKSWLHLVGQIQLRQLLTQQEKGAYEAMRWRLTDRSVQDLSDGERLRDVLNGMLGYECRQLRYSFRTSRLLLRAPEQQRNLSESYLLLALGHLGCLYRELQNQQKRLLNLGKSGLALAQSQREELLQYKQFHRKYQKLENPASLFQLWKSSRNFQSRFEWMLNLNCLIFEEANVLSTLSKELFQGYYENLLQNWLLLVSQTMLENLSRWLRFGELLKTECAEFFIIENLTLPTENFWQGRFTLVTKLVPLFLSNKLCHLILNVGKCHRYSKEFLGIDVEVPLSYQKLAKAFQLTYLNHDMEPLNDLVALVNQDISSYIFTQHEPAIDLFYKLFKYILLRDLHFVTKLVERLEPLLEQSVDLFDLHQLNSVLKQILTKDNSELYMEEISSEGFLCWSKFQLCWRLADNWRALIGQSIQMYSCIFLDLWKFHTANYILCERILRHKYSFGRRIELEYLADVNQVERRFQALLDLFISVMRNIRHYLLIQVLDEAYGQLKLKCNEAKTLDDIVQAHKQYLNAIAIDLFLTKNGSDCKICLNQLYHFVFDLDIEQQKFLSQCQLLTDYLRSFSDEERLSKCQVDFHLACKRTWNILNDLGRKFSINLIELRANLNKIGERKFKLLAKKLNGTRKCAPNALTKDAADDDDGNEDNDDNNDDDANDEGSGSQILRP
ncbi:uncharacterized protein t-Grip91 [Drosophila tropicalis]|uniref:uncharacterized protein t-Grip91 n=1 Tax=Drosophila tropicalis TaxID=46794 RepID=UPI0035AB80F5